MPIKYKTQFAMYLLVCQSCGQTVPDYWIRTICPDCQKLAWLKKPFLFTHDGGGLWLSEEVEESPDPLEKYAWKAEIPDGLRKQLEGEDKP